MTLHGQEQFRAAACIGKAGYRTPALAWKRVRRMNSRGKGVQAYRCEWCGKWHIGHVKRGAKHVDD